MNFRPGFVSPEPAAPAQASLRCPEPRPGKVVDENEMICSAFAMWSLPWNLGTVLSCDTRAWLTPTKLSLMRWSKDWPFYMRKKCPVGRWDWTREKKLPVAKYVNFRKWHDINTRSRRALAPDAGPVYKALSREQAVRDTWHKKLLFMSQPRCRFPKGI